MKLRSPAIATRIAVAVVVAAAAALCYARVLDAPLVLDDLRNVSENPALRWQRIGADELRRTVLESPTWRPVAYASFGVQSLFGAGVRGLRLANVAIHAACGLLVAALALGSYRRAARLTGTPPGLADPVVAMGLAGLAGLLFVVHPVQIQAVTYLVQRMASLATLLYLAALWLWLRGGESAARAAKRRWRGAALLCGLVACGAKEIAVTLPFAIALYEATFLGVPASSWRRALALGGFAVAVVALVLLATDGLSDYAAQPFGLAERLWSAPRALTFYASLIALPLPSRLNLLHDLPASTGWLDPPSTALAAIAWLAIAVAAWLARRRVRFASFALAWLLIHLALESSFIPLALVFEHRLYLPLVGVAIALPPLALQALGTPRRTFALGLGVVVALAVATLVRNETWRDPVALWGDAVAKSPASARAHDELGLALQSAGQPAAARAAFERAVRLDPQRSAEPLTHLGWLLRQQGDLAGGESRLREALQLEPGYARAWHALGLLQLQRGRPGEAADLLARAVALAPRDAAMRSNYGTALARSGRSDAARAQWQETLRIDPFRHQTHAQLGELEMELGDAKAARDHLRTAAAGDPTSLAIRNNLAWLLATSADVEVRDPATALALAEPLRAEAPDDPGVLDTFAAARAAVGDFDTAERVARRAAELADRAGDAGSARRMRARAERYRAGRPLIEGGANEPSRAEPSSDSSVGKSRRIYSGIP